MSARKIFHNSVVPLPPQTGLTPDGLMVNAAVPRRDEPLTLHFSLSIPPDVQKELEQRVSTGEVTGTEELDKMYRAKPEDTQSLSSWLEANGYEITHTSSDGIYARASAGQIAQTLHVNMVPVTKDGVTYMAAQNDPSLPVEVSDGVQRINGLQPFRQANKHLRRYLGHYGNGFAAGGNGAAAATAVDPTPQIGNAPPYLAAEILGAYGAKGLGVSGKGQIIAILIDTFPADSDLTAFWARNGLSNTLAQIEKINVSGGPLPPPTGEETLDASWASAIAPGAQVRIYASGALSFVALDRALDRIIEDLPSFPGMRQLSISLGLGEQFMSPSEVDTEHTKFLRLAAAGVNVFVSSGDAGSNPDVTGHSPTGPLQAEYESSDTAVIGVGGTTLELTATGAVRSETGWSSSGGGTSRFFSRPTWQTGTGVPNGSMRLVPDVSLAADPNSGAFLIFQGQPTIIGGTSWSAPVWAGFCALINEARKKTSKPALGFLNPLMYPLNGTPALRDITSGTNGAFHCGPGYDQVTGLGVPNVKELIARLR